MTLFQRILASQLMNATPYLQAQSNEKVKMFDRLVQAGPTLDGGV